MTNTNDKRPKVNPGLVRSETNYVSVKKAPASNPTKQVAVVALPTTEKENTFTILYEESLKESWLPVAMESVESIVSISSEENHTEPIVHKQRPKQETKFKYEKVEPIKTNTPTDMEILMSQNIQSAPKVEVKSVQPAVEFMNVEPEVKLEKPNVFETINAIPVSGENKTSEHQIDKKLFNAEKAFMKIDKVEIRKTTNEKDEAVYMIDKDFYTEEQFYEYMQSVYGKLLSSDCKKLEYRDISYTRSGNGTYKDSGGNIIPVDELIKILEQKEPE